MDYAEVPYLEEILEYLPIDPTDSEDVATYVENISDLISVNYRYGQYQFAYFGLHLLYMTYIYCTVWKISMILPDRYRDSVVFARPYQGAECDLYNIKSIFQYSKIPEKELPKIFSIINLDNAQIGLIRSLVDIRDNMAHASGRFEIITDEVFDSKANSIYNSIINVRNCMETYIRCWFESILTRYCDGSYDADYDDIADIITTEMVQNFSLSVNELLICNTMSVRGLEINTRGNREKLRRFKAELEQYCRDNGYIV